MERSGEAGTLGLPRAFLHSLRTLFDILDDRRRGSVHIAEIESRWQGAETRDLPPGVLQCLRRVAPPDGYLTFDRFVLGLRASMLRPPPGANAENYREPGGQPAGKSCACKPPPLGVRYPNVQQGGEVKGMCRSRSEATRDGLTDQCKHQRGRGEPRRHTITNGVDYSLLKKMKELEQEKDFLLQGLEMVERARDWYHQQIHIVQEQQRNLGKTDYNCEVKSSSLNQRLPKLQEVNRCLGELVASGKSSAPSPPTNTGQAVVPGASGQQVQAVTMLKEQNRLLTKEVSEKSDRITQLEHEKSALIKQLFEARARNIPESNPMDSTFI
ncbi:suppressor APC domain-containing protein 2 isoform X2 [Xenopus laevis]|uniref:Suppressor APC domain-containing protein 2 isoform X2 n=1 Tax=Xenopus laevis TaxID=8355 RepID=A0A8J0TMF4_XENLA|nr:suppressor APC domain-containing protein 2 isoform X2 [Xenopus laevis]